MRGANNGRHRDTPPPMSDGGGRRRGDRASGTPGHHHHKRRASSRGSASNKQHHHSQHNHYFAEINHSLLLQQLQLNVLPYKDGPKTLFLGNMPDNLHTARDFRAFLALDVLFGEALDDVEEMTRENGMERDNNDATTPGDGDATKDGSGNQQSTTPIRTRYLEQSRFGFVTLRTHQEALRLRDAMLDKKDKAHRQLGREQHRRRGARGGASPREDASLDQLHHTANFRINWVTNWDEMMRGRGYYLFVKNLPTEVTDLMLERFFKLRYHEHVTRARVVVEQESGISKGHGWVAFNDAKVRQQAFTEMHREFLGTKRIRVALVVRGQFTEHEDGPTEESDQAEERMLLQERMDRSICIEGLQHNITTHQIKCELLRHVPEEARRHLNPRMPRVFENFTISEDHLMAFVRLPTPELARHIVHRLNRSVFLGCFVKVRLTNMAVARYQIHSEKQWRQYFVTIHQQQMTLKRIFEKQQPLNFEDNPLKAYNVARSNAHYAETDMNPLTLTEMEECSAW